MEDYDKVLEATSVAENANGVAAEKMTVYNESLEAAQNRLTASVQQFAQDSNLDRILALAYDGLSKVVEILNILLNKIPVLSPLIKEVGVALAFAFAAKTIANIANTSKAIGGLVSAITSVSGNVAVFASLVAGEFTAALSSGLIPAIGAAGSAITTLLGPVGTILALLGAVVAIAPAVYSAWQKIFPSVEEKANQSKKALEESDAEIEETKSKIQEIAEQIKAINEKGTLTLADEAEKERLQEQLDLLEEIKKTQEAINKEKSAQALSAEQAKAKKMTTYSSEDVSQYQTGLQSTQNYATALSTGNINETIAAYQQLNEEKKNLNSTDEDYAEQLKTNQTLTSSFTTKLLEQKQTYLDEMKALSDLGDTSSETYKSLQQAVDMINVTLDPSNFETLKVQNLIDTSGISDKLQEAVQDGGEAGQKTAKEYANKFAQQILNSDDSIKAAWAQAMNIDVNDLNIDNLTQELLTKFRQMYGQVNQAIFELTSEQVADWTTEATNALVTQDEAMKDYISTVANVTEKQEILNTAYSEMKEKGELSVATVQKLIKQEPSLVSALTVENGHIRINIDSLQDLSNGYFDTAIETKKQQITQTQSVIDKTKKRIESINQEMIALGKLIKKRIEAGEKVSATDLDTYRGQQKTKYYLEQQGKQAQETQDDLQEQLDALTKLQEAGLTYTPSKGKSSGKTAADKAAKDFENAIKEKIKNLKSIVELYSERTDWDDPTVIQEFTNDYNNLFDEVINNPKARKILADSFNLDISEMSDEKAIEALTALWKKQAGTIDEARQKLQDNYLKGIQDAAKAEKEQFDEAKKQIEELNKMTTNMIKTYVGLLEKAGNLVFSILEKVSDRYDKQIDNLDKIMDGLDDQKDAFDDKIDAQKEYLQLQKEEMDNEDKLAEKTKSIADIDARLIELQYDDSAAAQAERLKLLDQRAEAEKDLKDLQAEQAYDSQINALDAQKKQFDKDIEAQKKALEEQKKALEESQTKFENTLNKIKSGFDGFIKVLNSDIFQNLAANLLNSIDGDTLKQALYSWNRLFGSGIDADVTNTLQAYGTAGKYGWTPGKNMQDFLNMFTQGSNTQQQILDQVEQAISSNKAGNLDISGYKNNIDFLNKSWDSFKQNAIDSVTQVGESSQSIVKNLWDFGNKMLNQESASGSGVVRTIAKGISTTIKSGKKGISTFLQQGIQANQALGISGQGILSQVGNFAQNIMKLVGGSGGGILKTTIQFGSTLLGKISGTSLSLAKGITTVGGNGIATIGNLGVQVLKSLSGVATSIFGSSATAGITSMIPTLGSAAGGLGSAAGLLGLGAKGGLIGLAVAGGAILSSGIKSNLKNLWGSNLPTWKKVTGTALNFLTPAGLISGVKNIFKGIFGRHHSGADYVKKQNPALDKILGLGSDETVSILKVGEAVVPTWANNASSSASNSNYTGAATQAVRAAQQASRISSSVNNSNSSVVNTISIPINIQGNADESTVKLLREESDKIAKMVFKQINKQTNMSGYKNIRAATI